MTLVEMFDAGLIGVRETVKAALLSAGFSSDRVDQMLVQFRPSNSHRWSDHERQVVRDLYAQNVPVGEIARQLGLSVSQITGQVAIMRLHRPKGGADAE